MTQQNIIESVHIYIIELKKHFFLFFLKTYKFIACVCTYFHIDEFNKTKKKEVLW